MIKTHAPSIVLIVLAMLLTIGLPAAILAIPFILALAVALAIYAHEVRLQIRSERRSGHDRRRCS